MTTLRSLDFLVVYLLLIVVGTCVSAQPILGGCEIFPADNWWNTPIESLPVHSKSEIWKSAMGNSKSLYPGFGTDTHSLGIPYTIVPYNQTEVEIDEDSYADESDPGPFPIPDNPPIEGGDIHTVVGDNHVLVLQQESCILYELWVAYKNVGVGWSAAMGAKWNLSSNSFRPLGWTSADAAGLPILPGLIKYDEIIAGEIKHAIRFATPNFQNVYIWPASHVGGGSTNTSYPPLGARFRLRASFNISKYSLPVQVILTALKKYGMVLAETYGRNFPWLLSGAPDERWKVTTIIAEMSEVLGSDFEAVDVSSLMVSPTSGQVKRLSTTAPTTATSPTVSPTQRPTNILNTKTPTTLPSLSPTRRPTNIPSSQAPTKQPSTPNPTGVASTPKPTPHTKPGVPTRKPTRFPTRKPTRSPTPFPTHRPKKQLRGHEKD